VILRRVHVEGWRHLATKVEVGPFSEGLNVLHGPNATGKSTLFEAITRALLDDHRVTGKDADGLRSWGRALAPSVTVEITHGGAEYRITKRFLDEPFAKLERREGGRFVAFAEREAAVTLARELLSKSPPARGLSQLKNWGIAQVLWAVQRGGGLGELSADVVSQMQARLTGNGASPERESGPIERAIEELYASIYTQKGELKRGKDAPAIVRLRAELESARAAERQALDEQERFEEAVRGFEDLKARRAQAARDVTELRATLERARNEAAEQRRLLERRRELEARAELARAGFRELEERAAELKHVRASLKEQRERLARIESDAPARERELESRRQVEHEADRALQGVREDLRKLGDSKKSAELAMKLHDTREKLLAAQTRLRDVRTALDLVASRKKARGELVAPDAKALAAIRASAKQRDEAQVRLDSSLITLEILPERRGNLHVVTGEDLGDRELDPGVPLEVKGSPRVVVDVPGFGRVSASGPSGSSTELREKRDEAARRLADLTRGLGTSELGELDELHEKAKRLDDHVDKAEAQLSTLLGGANVETLERAHALLARSVDEILASRPAWRDAPPDAAALAASVAAGETSLVAEVQALETRWKAAYKALSDAKERQGTIGAETGAARAQLASLEAARAELEGDGKSDAEREAQRTEIAIKVTAADAELAAVQRALGSITGDPLELSKTLEARLADAEKASATALVDEVKADARIAELAMRGTYSALAAIQERRVGLEANLAREELRANAVRLLRDTVKTCREEARAVITGPIEKVATRILERVSGRRLGRLELSEAFSPAHVVPESLADAVALERVSGGEEEQIQLAARLALADVLAKDERQLVVLDDVLVHTDAARHARILRVLEEAAGRLQVLIITCHPEWYRGLEGATYFDLEKIARDGDGV
jgi:DNA repair exonuclease SbcCD ATPase subunit